MTRDPVLVSVQRKRSGHVDSKASNFSCLYQKILPQNAPFPPASRRVSAERSWGEGASSHILGTPVQNQGESVKTSQLRIKGALLYLHYLFGSQKGRAEKDSESRGESSWSLRPSFSSMGEGSECTLKNLPKDLHHLDGESLRDIVEKGPGPV